MYEKVNPSHPDKVADRIAGAIVDLAYEREEEPRVAAEVLIGHGYCYIIIESSVDFTHQDIEPIVERIAGNYQTLRLISEKQDPHLAENQDRGVRCGDNGIFRGTQPTIEQRELTSLMRSLYGRFPTDGKAVFDSSDYYEDEHERLIICQSDAKAIDIVCQLAKWADGKKGSHIGCLTIAQTGINPLGYWEGGLNVDTGATNRKLGSDMGDAVTGGGLHGKDLSKADVSVNIYLHMIAERDNCEAEAFCAIGDEQVTIREYNLTGTKVVTVPYSEIVSQARQYVRALGGFERLAEWGLIR